MESNHQPLYLLCLDCQVALNWSANYNEVGPYLFALDHEGHRLEAIREGDPKLKGVRKAMFHQKTREV